MVRDRFTSAIVVYVCAKVPPTGDNNLITIYDWRGARVRCAAPQMSMPAPRAYGRIIVIIIRGDEARPFFYRYVRVRRRRYRIIVRTLSIIIRC